MIQLIDLKAQFQAEKTELQQAINRVLASGVYLMGPELVKFEQEFANYLKIKHVIGVGSGTDALTLTIKALGLTRQDEVIVPANAYPTAFGIASANVSLRLCDVDPNTANLTPKTISSALTSKTKAIVAVHLYGLPAPMKEINKLAKKHKLFVIEDCAQTASAFGDLACFSFYPTKNLACLGDGGAIATNSSRLAKKLKQLRMYGEKQRYHSLTASAHSRLDEIQSAILRVRLKTLSKQVKKRRELANYYRSQLPAKMLLVDSPNHAYHLFVIKTPRRKALQNHLSKHGIQTAIHYPKPIHFQPAFKYLNYRRGDFPNTEKLSRQVLSLPLHPYISKQDQDKIIRVINKFYADKN